MKKLKVAVLFGSPSPEHEVSLASAKNVLQSLDRGKYQVYPFGILKNSQWVSGEDALLYLVSKAKSELLPVGMEDLLPVKRELKVEITEGKIPPLSLAEMDVVFPVLHGSFGEDGRIQGLFEMLGLAYVGCDVFSSAVCMDKIACKNVLSVNQIQQAKWIEITDSNHNIPEARIKSVLGGFPVFVKPANAGSSVGISKVKSIEELETAILEAKKFDERVLIEEALKGRELEVGVLGYAGELEVSAVAAEIIPKREFYDYEAKYHDSSTEVILPAKVKPEIIARLQETSKKAFQALKCSGLSRIDFFYNEQNDCLYLNEVNTLPGFTKISQYPRLMTAGGRSYSELLDELIKIALIRKESSEV